MTARVTVYMFMNRSDFEEGKLKTMADFDEMEAKGGSTGSAMGDKFLKGFSSPLKGFGTIVTSIGNEMNNLGLPFGNVMTKMGAEISSNTTKMGSFKASLETIGKVSVFGGLVAGAGIAAEGIKLWDGYEKALVSFDTVAKNSGTSIAVANKELAAGSKTAAKLGFDNTDLAKAMANLTTATGSTKKAFADMGLVEDLARYKNVSLADAADALDHVYGGSTRTLLSWGININVASGRLHSLQTMQEAVSKAQLQLQNVQAKMNDGMLVGVAATNALSSAQLALKDAQTNYAVAAGTVSKVIDTLRERTKGAADMFSKTFAGQIAASRAELHNYGVTIGHDVVEVIQHLEVEIARVINWFEKYKAVAIVLGAVLAGPIVLGTLLFLGETVVNLGTSFLTVGNRFNTFGLQSKEAAIANDQLQASIDALTGAITKSQLALTDLVDTEKLAQDTASILEESNMVLATSYGDVAAQAELASTDMKLVGTSALTSEGGVSLATAGMLGGIGLVVGALAMVVLGWGQVAKAADAAKIAQGQATYTNTQNWENAVGNGGPNVFANMNAVLQTEKNQLNSGTGIYAPIGTQLDYRGRKFAGSAQAWARGKQNPNKDISDLYTKLIVHTDAYNALQRQILGQEKETALYEKNPAALKAAEKKYKVGTPVNPEQQAYNQMLAEEAALKAEQKTGKATTSTAPVGFKQNPLITQAQQMLQQMQAALQTGTIQSLAPEMQGGPGGGRPLTAGNFMNAQSANGAFQKMIDEVRTLFSKGLDKQGQAVLTTYNAMLHYYGQLEANITQVGINAQTQAATTQYTDQTQIIQDMAAQVVQHITDMATIATAKATKTTDLLAEQGQTQADILGERGLYGLNLVTQEMKVGLDKITQKWTQAADTQSIAVGKIAAQGNVAVSAAKVQMDKVQKSSDLSVGIMQKIADMAQAGGTSLQQTLSGTKLTTSQMQQAKLVAKADRAYDQAQNIANKHNALAQSTLTAIQNAGKIAEAKQNALIAIEQAKANTEFAGSGVHIEITGISPTDAAAVGAAVSWQMRTKVPK